MVSTQFPQIVIALSIDREMDGGGHCPLCVPFKLLVGEYGPRHLEFLPVLDSLTQIRCLHIKPMPDETPFSSSLISMRVLADTLPTDKKQIGSRDGGQWS